MKAIYCKKNNKWKFGNDGEAIYSSPEEAEREGKKIIEINLNKILNSGRKISNN